MTRAAKSYTGPAMPVGRLCSLAVLLVGLLSSKPLRSQLITSEVSQYAHSSWLSRDGSFRGNLNSITQTKDGYIWIASAFGLLKFDGVTFSPGQPEGGQNLGKFQLAKVFGAKDGSLWIGLQSSGLLHLKDGKMTKIPALDGLIVVAIVEDRTGGIWVGGIMKGSSNRLCRIDANTTHCFGDTKTFGNRIATLFEDKRGILWVGADTGLWRWGPGPPKLFSDRGEDAASNVALNSTDTLADVARGKNGMRSSAEKRPIAGSSISLMQLAECHFLTDREGGLWIGRIGQGLIHSLHGRIDNYGSKDGLSSDQIFDLFEDREGNIWVVTENGLDRFRKQAIAIVTQKQGLSSNAITSVLKDGHDLWVASFNGLNRVTDKTIEEFGKQSGLPSNDTRSLYLAAPGKLLVASGRPNGLEWMQNGRFTPLPTPSGENNFVITTDGSSGLWLSNRESGLIHVQKSGKAEVFPWDLAHGGAATAMAFDSQRDGVWLARPRGDLEFFQRGAVRERYLNARENFQNPRNLLVSQDGTVWLSSNAGLTRLSDGKMSTLSSQNGLPCDEVHWFKDEDQHSSWLNTACGLVRLAPGELDRWSKDPTVQVKITAHLDTFEGAENLMAGGYYSPQVVDTPDGRLAFVTENGLAVLDPHQDFINHQVPPVHISLVEADGQSFSPEQAINLRPKTHAVRLGYNAMSFRIPQKVRFRYKLDGYDTHWSEELSTREATYTNLPPGKYYFHVIASNDSGVWNETGDTLALSVRPAFYQTVWFLSICIAAAGLSMWMAYRYRVRYICQQVSNRIEAQTTERLKVSRDLHDTLLQSVQGLLLSFHALSEDPTIEGTLRERIVALGDRAERVIGEGREKIKALRFEKHSNHSFTEEIASIAHDLRPGEMPVFQLAVTGNEQELNPLVYEEMCFICREALSNAFQHASAQRVEALVSFSRTRFGVIVRDDGRGFQPHSIGRGSPDGHWGILGMKERAARIGAEIKIRSSFPERTQPGTSVIIDIPAPVAYASTNF